jgi:uncharacterized protein DUF4326
MAQRIQRKRTKGYRMPEGVVYVGRPTKYGNPYVIGDVNPDTGKVVTPSKCLEYYRDYLERRYPGEALREFLAPLRGKDLACWCRIGNPCHGDVLVELSNRCV